jgi:hypothetical protein
MLFLILLSATVNGLTVTRQSPATLKNTVDESEGMDLIIETKLKPIVIMAEVTPSFIEEGFFQNWAHYAKPFLNSSMSVVLDCPEPKAQEMIAKMDLPFTPVFIDRDFHVTQATQFQEKKGSGDQGAKVESYDKAKFGSAKYKHLMLRRPKAIQTLLATGVSVLSIDLDTAWAHNPFDRISEAGAHDVFITRDGDKWCGCFLFFRSTPETQKFASVWLEQAKNDWYGNQQSLNFVIENSMHDPHPKTHTDISVLERKDFPSGKGAAKHKDPTVYHANWLRQPGMKKKFFMGHDMWYNSTKDEIENAKKELDALSQ